MAGDGGNNWRQEILEDVKTVSVLGRPGTLAVHGEKAEPVLTGASSTDVLLAAATIAKGKIAVFSHTNYADWFLESSSKDDDDRLRQNILSWLTNEKYSEDAWALMDFDDADETLEPDKLVVVWKVRKVPEQDSINSLQKMVRKGGAVIIAVHPTSHASKFKGDLSKSPLYGFLKEAGIFLTTRSCQLENPKVDVSQNQAKFSHIGRWLKECLAKREVDTTWGIGVALAIGSLEDEDCTELLNPFVNSLNLESLYQAPTKMKPLKANKRIPALLLNIAYNHIDGATPALGAHNFPGAFSSEPLLYTKQFKVDSRCKDVHPTGTYLPPGGTVKIETLEGIADEWEIQIGCHSDNLSTKSIYKRWPDICTRKKLNQNDVTEIYSAFGGGVYLCSPEEGSSITISLANVVPAPLYHVNNETSVNNWKDNRARAGLWADFVGKHVMITMPSKVIRDLDDPLPALQFWDKVICAQHDLCGLNPFGRRRQWFVPDLQPFDGEMHSGYPIVTNLDVTKPSARNWLLKVPEPQDQDDYWPLFHEIGHNMQHQWWTPSGTEEVTCDIFTMHSIETLFGIPAWDINWIENNKKHMKKFLREGSNFDTWTKNPHIAIGVYAQLARDYGFEAYKEVFRNYQKTRPNLKTDKDKIDHWIRTFSKIIKRNPAPVFQMWGIPISEGVAQELKAYIPYVPDDEVTQVVLLNRPLNII